VCLPRNYVLALFQATFLLFRGRALTLIHIKRAADRCRRPLADEAHKRWIEITHFRPPQRAAIGESIAVVIAITLTDRIENLKTGNRQFDRNQNHDDDLQAQRPPGVNGVGEDFGGVGDNGELAR